MVSEGLGPFANTNIRLESRRDDVYIAVEAQPVTFFAWLHNDPLSAVEKKRLFRSSMWVWWPCIPIILPHSKLKGPCTATPFLNFSILFFFVLPMLSACTISCDIKLHKITTYYVKMCYFLSLLSSSQYSFVTFFIIMWALVSYSSAVALLLLKAFLNIVHIPFLVFCSSISLVVRQLLWIICVVLLCTFS